MQINLTIKDTLYAKEVDAVAAMKGWTPTIPDPAFVPTETKTEAPQVPNITKDRFFKQQVKIWRVIKLLSTLTWSHYQMYLLRRTRNGYC
jgi:hypothetical protein